MTKKILFVDDDLHVLKGIRRLMFEQREHWEMDFATSGSEALEKLSAEHFDVIVSDMRMRGMDGAELLQRVADAYPHMVRIMLTGQSDQQLIMKSVANTHQFLTKPCESHELRRVLRRALSLSALLGNENLIPIIAKLKTLPSLPSLYQEIMLEMQKPEFSMERIADIIGKDVAMTAKILQMVNSSYFGLPVRIVDPRHAVKLLGAEIIKGLVLSVQIFSQFDGLRSKHLNIERFTEHSLAVGVLAKDLAEIERQDRKTAEACLIAGILHDSGKLVLAQNMPDAFDLAMQVAEMNKLDGWQGEKEILGSGHAEVGAYLIGLWGLSGQVVDALAYHHEPLRSGDTAFSPLTAVHVANNFIHDRAPDREYLARLGLQEHLEKWQQLASKQLLEAQHE